MGINKFPEVGGVISDATIRINNNNNVMLKQCGLSIIRQLQDRTIFLNKSGGEFAEAYTSAAGRLNSVDTTITTAIFDIDKYKSDGEVIIRHNLPLYIVPSTIPSYFFCGVLVEDFEPGIDIQCRLLSTIDVLDVSNSSYEKSFNVSTQENIPRGLFIGDSGTKMYIIGSDELVYQYTLSTAYDVYSASYVQSFTTTSIYSENRDIFFKNDGTKMYTIGTSGRVIQYALSTAWDVSTSTLEKNKSVTIGATNSIYDVSFGDNGSKMYVCSNNGIIEQYNLSTPWDIATETSSSTLDVSDIESLLNSIILSSDGSNMLIVGTENKSIIQYSLSSNWNITSSSIIGSSASVGSEESFPSGLYLNPNENKIYHIGSGSKNVNQYDISFSSASGWGYINEVSSTTGLNSFPNSFEIKLIPKSSNPTVGYPSINGVALFLDDNF